MKFFANLFGHRTILITGHRLLLSIFGSSKGLPVLSALRLQWYFVFFQAFNYDIQYRPGEEHGNAAFLSRLPPSTNLEFGCPDAHGPTQNFAPLLSLCWRRFFQNRPRSETQHGPTHNERVCPLNQLVKFAFNQPLHWVLPPLNSTATLRQYHQHEREEETRRDCEECASFETPTVEEALDKAADDFEHVHNTLVGKLENRKGVELMQAGHYKEAVKLFRRASDYYSAPGAFNLGLSYEKGQGTLQSWKRAAKWYQIASDRGHAEAMYNLGVMYVHGRGGLPMDYDKAKNLFESAAKLGQPDALHALDMAKHTPVTDDQDSQINRELLFKRHNDVEELYEALGINKSDQDRVLSNPIEVQSQNTLEIVQAKVLRATDVILQAVGIVNLQSQKKLEENIISNHSEELNDFEMFAAEQQELHDNYNVRNDLIKNVSYLEEDMFKFVPVPITV